MNTNVEIFFESRRQVSEKNEKLVADMGRGKLSATQIQTAVFQSSGNLLSLSTINSITDYYSNGVIKAIFFKLDILMDDPNFFVK